MVIFLALFVSCSKQGQKKIDNDALLKDSNKTTFKIILNTDQTYGYTVLDEEEVVVVQKTIPGMSGASGFKKKRDAEAVALLVVDKMKKGIFPPTVTSDELNRLNIPSHTTDTN